MRSGGHPIRDKIRPGRPYFLLTEQERPKKRLRRCKASEKEREESERDLRRNGQQTLFQLSAVTVLSHVCLGVMCVTFPLRLYYKLLELLRCNPGLRPFQSYLDYDGSLTDEETAMLVEELVLLLAFAVTELKRLLFIDNVMDSLKFVLLLYLLTYVGVLTAGLTLVITAVIALFSFPLLYKKQQVRIRRMVRACKTFQKKIKSWCLGLRHAVGSARAPAAATKSAPNVPASKQKVKAK
ncbi:reticulon-2b isoform X1 [Phyllopteryx taeniolatus]|uniref:reticulon-2b isoform X1 n=1 Tax=Phyllopteryx taeniolatus TaxID=161469 RepID=UPI002AD57C63|nr:reticulon-2b isoform X1 [Phyllopteryx taeniolatus]